ncbi:MAG: carbohydrate kinase [Armatimonadetes bacterium]|nr:carbohydrate kinase [Armatimonadota bacterium]
MPAFLLGVDIGTSAVKVALVDASTGAVVATRQSPESAEIPLAAPQPGWAEQDPADWWQHFLLALQGLGEQVQDVQAVGIAYQMHGLVLVDGDDQVVRPSIIWCDGRAVATGAELAKAVGREECLRHALNTPGNFTVAKAAWVRTNEPDTFAKARHMMLPGDDLARRLTGLVTTTPSGLSEMAGWSFASGSTFGELMEAAGTNHLVPEIVPTFGDQGRVTVVASQETGLPAGTPVTYRAGDQPNNALSLGVFESGEAAATAGTSGVVYVVSDTAKPDPAERVNPFLHVNGKIGTLLCVNGTGSFYSWIRRTMCADKSFKDLNSVAESAPVGADDLLALPYGNGAERSLGNRTPGASFQGLDFARHGLPHIARAGMEGIVCALKHGFEAMKELGCGATSVRAGQANMFLSPLFAQMFADATQCEVKLYDTDGAVGAARGAGIGLGLYNEPRDAFAALTELTSYKPGDSAPYDLIYKRWRGVLEDNLR